MRTGGAGPKTDEDFTALWERHIEASRRGFSKTAEHEMPRHGDEVGRLWDERMDSVVEALEELYAPSTPSVKPLQYS